MHADVERWRGIAILQTDPDDEPLDITTATAGMWRMSSVETVDQDVDASSAALPTDLANLILGLPRARPERFTALFRDAPKQRPRADRCRRRAPLARHVDRRAPSLGSPTARR